jgi:hypothetical protein
MLLCRQCRVPSCAPALYFPIDQGQILFISAALASGDGRRARRPASRWPRLPARSRWRSQHASRLCGLIVGCEAGLGCWPGWRALAARRRCAPDPASKIRQKEAAEPILAVVLLDALFVDSRCASPGRAFSSGTLGRRVAAAAAVNVACGGLTAIFYYFRS